MNEKNVSAQFANLYQSSIYDCVSSLPYHTLQQQSIRLAFSIMPCSFFFRFFILCYNKSTQICRLFLNYCYKSSMVFFPRRDKLPYHTLQQQSIRLAFSTMACSFIQVLILCYDKSTQICRLFLNYCYKSSMVFFPRRDKYRLNLLCV